MKLNQDKSLDFKSIEEIESKQLELLQNHLNYVYTNSKWFQNKWEQAPQINSLKDLVQLGFTEKKEVELANEQFVCVSAKEITELVSTSGTTGKPLVISLTQKDLDRLAYNEHRALEIAGIEDSDVVQITTTLDKMFVAGMAYYKGIVSIGATVIRMGVTQPEAQLTAIKNFKSSALICVPSYLNKIKDFAISQGFQPNELPVKKVICIGEILRNKDLSPNTLHKSIANNWNVELFSTYASTEGMTAFTECNHHNGGHLIPELMIVETVNEKGENVPNGELGEVVITPLGITGTPLIRYKTGDLARLHSSPCACGRNTPRLGPIEGRKKHMIKLKGTTIFPSSIENVIRQVSEIQTFVIQLESNHVGLDQVKLKISDQVQESTIQILKKKLADQIRVVPTIEQLPIDVLQLLSMPKGARKPIKLIDKRNASNE